jgi:hypothetical protein
LNWLFPILLILSFIRLIRVPLLLSLQSNRNGFVRFSCPIVVTGPTGLYGIGQISGDRYQANGVTIQAQRQDSIPGEELIGDLTGTLIDRTRLVGTRGHDTLDFHLRFHLTKVDGELIVIWERFSFTCS